MEGLFLVVSSSHDKFSIFSNNILFGSAMQSCSTPLQNHMYFETDFKVFKIYFQYLNTIFLY